MWIYFIIFSLTLSLSTQESIVLGAVRFKRINTIFDPRISYWADRTYVLITPGFWLASTTTD